MSRDWSHGLFSCFSSGGDCLLGWCCPCILYGKANHRVKHPQDPGMSGYSTVNGPCAFFCLGLYLTGGLVPCVMQTLQRGEIRSQLGIQGSSAGDCFISCCCHCCSLIQNEHEVQDWQEKRGAYAAAPVQPGMQQPMQYGHGHGHGHPQA